MRQNDGTAFIQRLGAMWLASGALTNRRVAALRAHARRVTAAGHADDRPGSYSWPLLRREAEERFAAGHDPRQVIQELRDRHRDCPAMTPSVRTMQRWYTQARWLTPASGAQTADERTHARRRVPSFMLIPTALLDSLPRNQSNPNWRGS